MEIKIKTLVAMVVLMLVTMGGCSLTRSVERRVEARAATSVNAVKKDGTPVFLCAGKDKDGSPCKRHVKTQGDYCWMHKPQANPCWVKEGGEPKEDCYYQEGDVTRPISGKP